MSKSASHEVVITLGPASWHLADSLCDAGATAFRLNASHMTPEDVASRTATIRRRLPGFPLVIDLQGAKMRLGQFDPMKVGSGEKIRFSLRAVGGTCPLPHAEIFQSARPGDTLSCDDDRIRFRLETVQADELVGRALAEGVLFPRKGVNVVEHPVVIDDLSSPDLDRLEAAVASGCTAFAISFMKDGHEADWVRRRVPGAVVAGKIERAEAVCNLIAIAREVDSLWICRGDLGAQLGQASMARWVSACNPSELTCPVLMAGQVLEHLTRNAEPTRSEVCHVFDLVSRGYSGFVLSDETAVGCDPVHAVRTLRALLTSFQPSVPDRKN
jgi:pyruvate kinase